MLNSQCSNGDERSIPQSFPQSFPLSSIDRSLARATLRRSLARSLAPGAGRAGGGMRRLSSPARAGCGAARADAEPARPARRMRALARVTARASRLCSRSLWPTAAPRSSLHAGRRRASSAALRVHRDRGHPVHPQSTRTLPVRLESPRAPMLVSQSPHTSRTEMRRLSWSVRRNTARGARRAPIDPPQRGESERASERAWSDEIAIEEARIED